VAFHHGQGGGGEGSAYANLSPDLREYTPSTLDPHISGQGKARKEISTVLERGIKGLSNSISFVCVG